MHEQEAMDDGLEFEIAPNDKSDTSDGKNKHGLYVVFELGGGQTLELHVPNVEGVRMGGDSNATAPSFFLVNGDGSVEASGSMILAGIEDLGP
jgi:hypothetical protein